MDHLIAARSQMALSLGFHIIFASIGVAMPFLMATAHFFSLRRNDADYTRLTKAWSKGVAIFFAVGAVSGTALSFELGLLWPGFMKIAGPVIGMPFSWEGTAFFLEAIALGVFLYGWDRVPKWIHWFSGVCVGLTGVASAMFVICANGWMNSPTGMDWNNGKPLNINPYAAMFNDAALVQGLHMVVAAFAAVGFAVAGCHAFLWLKTRHTLHRKAVVIAFVFGALASIIQPAVGDLSAKSVARRQPLKLAAMEALFETQTRAPLLIGGWPDMDQQKVDFGFEIPGLLSWIAYKDIDARVLGLRAFPRNDWPPVRITHTAFQTMVGIGMLLLGISVLGLFVLWRRPALFWHKRWQRLLILLTPMGFIALEAGWVVTETGRQPWIIYGLLRTADAVTPRPGVSYTFALYVFLYGFLTLMVAFLLYRQMLLLHRSLESPKP